MIIVFVIALLVVVVIFGVSSGMQSYATAQQAQAQIETAKAAQINAWGNVITLLVLFLFGMAVLLLIAALIRSRRSLGEKQKRISQAQEPPALPAGRTLEMLLQLKMVEFLASHTPQKNLLEAPREEPSPVDDLFPWLK